MKKSTDICSTFETRTSLKVQKITTIPMKDFSFISNAHPAFIESLYEQYQRDPELVERVIRRKLGYVRGQEFVFRFDEPTPPQ